MYEYEMEESERKGITACTSMKWKRVSVRYHSMYGYEMEESERKGIRARMYVSV